MLTMPASWAYHVVMVCCQHHGWWALDAYYAGIMGSPCYDDLKGKALSMLGILDGYVNDILNDDPTNRHVAEGLAPFES